MKRKAQLKESNNSYQLSLGKFCNLNVPSLISLIGHNTIKNILLSYIRALICNEYIWKIIFKLQSYSFRSYFKTCIKDIGLHFLTYFADTSFYLLVIKSIYHQYSYQLTIEKMKLHSNLLSDFTHSSWIKFD